MRYTMEYEENARANLVDAGGRHAKQHGITSSGMLDLAAAPGVTTGSWQIHVQPRDAWAHETELRPWMEQ